MNIISTCYLIILAGIWLLEWQRTKLLGPDLLSLLLVIFSVQTIIPGMLITMVFAIYDSIPILENTFFDRVYNNLTIKEPLITLIFSAYWVVALYAGWLLAHEILKNGRGQNFVKKKQLNCSSLRYTLVMLVGLVGMWLLMSSLGEGGSLFEAYQNLIQFRAGSEQIERNFLRANLFSSSQVFALISIIGLFCYKKSNLGILKIIFTMFCIIVFGIMCASRRAFAIQTILIYFVFVLMKKRWYFMRFILPITAVFFPVIAFGKAFLARLAFVDEVNMDLFYLINESLVSSFLTGISETGITLVESWATLIFIDIPFRFGVDHFLSIAQRIPVGFLFGWDKSFLPDRIVRISTETFIDRWALDIPPGFFGQMWLDFGFVGPLFWGLTFGLQMGFVQLSLKRFVQTYEVKILSVLLLFVIALPINTGSFDFTFSVDIFLLFILLIFIFGKPLCVLQKSKR